MNILDRVHQQCTGDSGMVTTIVTYLSVCLGYWIRSGNLPGSTFCWTAMVATAGSCLLIGNASKFISNKLQQRKTK
ncbi:hypothetical protein AHP1_2521 [Aeromonas phage Ahp1_CNU-2021]|nr:hypothetical protein AHP1_2521 [Aeromonas phage Ahp1_CNU-2021]